MARPLRDIQRWMQAVITHSGGVPAGLASQPARSQIDVSASDLERVILPSKALSSVARLEVYGNAYFLRLLECLRDEYPALSHAVGAEAFDALALQYLQAYPPSSYTLAQLGKDFPKYLLESRPEAEGPHPNWTDFLIELATLERHYSEIFDGPGPEGQKLLQPQRLLEIAPERWPSVRLVLVPWMRLATFAYPVHEYASAVRARREDPAPPAPAPTYLAITRRDYIVRRIPLRPGQFELLAAMRRGSTVAQAIEAAGPYLELEADQLATMLRDWFAEWSTAGWFMRVEI